MMTKGEFVCRYVLRCVTLRTRPTQVINLAERAARIYDQIRWATRTENGDGHEHESRH